LNYRNEMTQTEIANRARATGTTSDRRRSGRPRETTLRQDRHITLIHLRNRFATAVDTSRRTSGIRNNLKHPNGTFPLILE
jgi:hypothetical protein